MKTKTDLSSYNNDWYKSGPFLKKILWFLINSVVCQTKLLPISSPKRWLLKLFGARIGKGVVIKPRVNIKYPWRLEIGNHSWIGEGVWIDNLAQVKIGSHVCISQNAILLCGSHDYSKSTFDLMVGEIVLEDGVWIGAGSIVTKDTICKSHALLSLMSVAKGTLEPFSIYAGNPAIFVKNRNIKG